MPRLHLLSLGIFITSVLAMTLPQPAAPADTTPEAPTPTIPSYTVEYGNDSYQACGYFRGGQMRCPEDHVCIDNPRPSSCGQACDDHGVCVKRDAARCGQGFAACADGGRCRPAVFECVSPTDGSLNGGCASLCFPDYWNGEPDREVF
ncbi:hypothetical protein PpBr36_01379 [Pyricularia pennisetigena]|uniref:hypothetical protein n=1 Tax=Pyricularia pennisetigena TaxID=1578925 RepID=UPI00114EEFD6|nr:hypothetical protein PpBr36_01379 [Pyricularia pennisetigena]TLS28427.1 hypothetical protein PpBr36_01379 [Pyricularia pennisetigena]